MQQNKNWIDTGQEEAVERRSVLAYEDSLTAAHRAWVGLSEYASAKKPEQNIEDRVINAMRRIRENYRMFTENLDWKHPASRPFGRLADRIRQSVLYKVFREMPKCSLLHIHNAAGLSVGRFIELLEFWENNAVSHGHIYIVEKPNEKYIPGTLLFNPSIDLALCEQLDGFMKKPGADKVLADLFSFTQSDRADGIPYIWDEFNRIFMRMGNLFENRKFFYMYHYGMFREMIDDRIEYAEIRCSFTIFSDQPHGFEFKPWLLEGADIPFLDEMKRAAVNALQNYNQKHEEDSRKFYFKVILCARRDLDILSTGTPESGVSERDRLLLKMDSAIVMKQNPNYGDMIAGFDLVSEEDRGKNTYTLFSVGLYEKFGTGYNDMNLQQKVQDAFKNDPMLGKLRIQLIDLYLHDGESIWAEDDNIMDAAVMSKHRIGHGFDLNRYPSLLSDIAAQGKKDRPFEPFLEICPVSNQMLRYFTDLRTHSAYELIKSGIQCVLGNDDPMILGNPGLSFDFWETYVGMGLDMNDIKGLVFNAYVCETLALGGYPTDAQGSYVMGVKNMIDTFNDDYWMPFLKRADAVLNSAGLYNS